MSVTLDSIDLAILTQLQQDATTSNTNLAKKVKMAPSAVLERVKKLKQKGVILEQTARVHPEYIDLKLLAFIFIKSSEGPGNISVAKQLSKLPEVLELHHIAGEDCYIAKVRARDPQSLAQLMRDKFSKIPGLLSTKTTIVLETLKESNHLPIPKKM
ncbi:Lrp/AsnC family transcriptional regulator [Terrimonas sp. NA20]|uniref:Lrp/AsnC family transcriptional regulator n=1 Tax=Terrimonas ginsenosidimutans TaxID=2908004 RepID=A0ABS9KQU2_9BACT|nr:Lrp/AsnC family transcriptional regulator [Terrimonas ginsenosidimutans]MCG2614705.1 Lrp/AsnC family transcriptional regulator [Terrimonas ginsenosidimutans]